jgi:hypothetical protein
MLNMADVNPHDFQPALRHERLEEGEDEGEVNSSSLLSQSSSGKKISSMTGIE